MTGIGKRVRAFDINWSITHVYDDGSVDLHADDGMEMKRVSPEVLTANRAEADGYVSGFYMVLIGLWFYDAELDEWWACDTGQPQTKFVPPPFPKTAPKGLFGQKARLIAAVDKVNVGAMFVRKDTK